MRPEPRARSAAGSPILWLLALLTLAASATFPGAKSAAQEVRLALVIGNGDYRTAPLRNPRSDAKLMATTLRSLGFEVVERLDQDQLGLKRAIRDFGDRLDQAGDDAVAVVYYAGHGVQIGGRNYLIPINAEIERESDVDIEAVAADAILGGERVLPGWLRHWISEM